MYMYVRDDHRYPKLDMWASVVCMSNAAVKIMLTPIHNEYSWCQKNCRVFNICNEDPLAIRESLSSDESVIYCSQDVDCMWLQISQGAQNKGRGGPRGILDPCLGIGVLPRISLYFRILFRTSDNIHTLLFHRTLNCLVSHIPIREIMFDASKIQLLYLYT